MEQISNSELKKMQKNYNHMLELPIVKKLNKKLLKLKKENRVLSRLIVHLGETIEKREVVDLTSVVTDESSEDEEHIVYSIEEKKTPPSPATSHNDELFEHITAHPAF